MNIRFVCLARDPLKEPIPSRLLVDGLDEWHWFLRRGEPLLDFVLESGVLLLSMNVASVLGLGSFRRIRSYLIWERGIRSRCRIARGAHPELGAEGLHLLEVLAVVAPSEP